MQALFETEFTGVPECLFDPKEELPFQSNTSKLVCLLTESNGEPPALDEYEWKGCVIDLSVVIQAVGANYSAKG